MSQGHIIQL